jgi:hypothetical protein
MPWAQFWAQLFLDLKKYERRCKKVIEKIAVARG